MCVKKYWKGVVYLSVLHDKQFKETKFKNSGEKKLKKKISAKNNMSTELGLQNLEGLKRKSLIFTNFVFLSAQ